MELKRILLFVYVAVSMLLMISCSSGGGSTSPDGDEDASISGRITVNNLELWPTGDENLVFRAYEGMGRSKLIFEKILTKSTSGINNRNFHIRQCSKRSIFNSKINNTRG